MTSTKKRKKVKKENSEWACKFRIRKQKKKGDLVKKREKKTVADIAQEARKFYLVKTEGESREAQVIKNATCLRDAEEHDRKIRVTGESEEVVNTWKSHFSRVEMS